MVIYKEEIVTGISALLSGGCGIVGFIYNIPTLAGIGCFTPFISLITWEASKKFLRDRQVFGRIVV